MQRLRTLGYWVLGGLSAWPWALLAGGFTVRDCMVWQAGMTAIGVWKACRHAIFAVVLVFWAQAVSAADPDWAMIQNVVLAEAANQGVDGMTWVACTMRERGWNLNGYAGAKRRGLGDFVRRQPASARESAALAVAAARAGFDCGGATHFENTRAFGVPSWARDMEVVAVVRDQTFYRRRR